MKHALIITLLTILFTGQCIAQRTTRTRLHPKIERQTNPVHTPLYIIPTPESFTIAGFDKPLNSLRETFHFTNRTDSTITELFLTLNYTDTSLRQLHSQSRHVITTIPPQQTALISIPSFDRQKSFYYHLSRKPRVQATPFCVTITVDSVRISK